MMPRSLRDQAELGPRQTPGIRPSTELAPVQVPDPRSRLTDALALQGVAGNQVVQRRCSRQPPRSGGASFEQGLPAQLQAGIEGLSGLPMDDVRVHYHSDKPREVDAAAFTAHTDIHVAPGQERHLAHEAWHVVQQKQGRVTADTRVGGVAINSNAALEHEADRMGARASQLGASARATAEVAAPTARPIAVPAQPVRQLWPRSRTPTLPVTRSPQLDELVGHGVAFDNPKQIKYGAESGSSRFGVRTEPMLMQQYVTDQEGVKFYTAVTAEKAQAVAEGAPLVPGRNYLSGNKSEYNSVGYLYFGATQEIAIDFAEMGDALGKDWVILEFTVPEGTKIQGDPEMLGKAIRAKITVPATKCREVYRKTPGEGKVKNEAARIRAHDKTSAMDSRYD